MDQVANQDIRVLASGIDALVLSFKIEWENEDLFVYLAELKEKARLKSADYPAALKPEGDLPEWKFLMKPNGARGYEWLLIGHDYSLKIGKWREMITRPNIMAEIRSETLWSMGAEKAVEYLKSIIEGIGGHIHTCKLSRADLCVDIITPEDLWNMNLLEHSVTYATDRNIYTANRKLTGLSIGSGEIQARLYDKVLEINQKSKKIWMFDIWNIDEIPELMKIIRVEYQMRREFLKEMHMDTPEDLLRKSAGLWGYCTEDWLKFQDRPEYHHTMRKDLYWWNIVQDGFKGCQEGNPLVRDRAVSIDKRQRIDQVFGNILSVQAIEMERRKDDMDKSLMMIEVLEDFFDEPLVSLAMKEYPIDEKIKKKRAKYHRVISG